MTEAQLLNVLCSVILAVNNNRILLQASVPVAMLVFPPDVPSISGTFLGLMIIFFSTLYFGKRVDSEYHWLDSCFLTLLSWLCLKTSRQQDTFYFERDIIYYRTCTGSSCLVQSALLCLSAASRKDPKTLAYTSISISISTTFVTSCPQWLVAVNSFSLRPN